MGAQLWTHAGPWAADPNESLRTIQHKILAERYDLPRLIRDQLTATQEAVRLSEQDGDPYGLLEDYQEELASLEQISCRPLPTDPDDRLQLLRQLHRYTGEGIGNILAVTNVVEQWDPDVTYIHVTRVLKPDAYREYCGTDRPTEKQAKQAVSRINAQLGRGESVCFPYYKDSTDSIPAGWYFAGNTVD